jgi:hypothetical protein
MNWRQKLSVLLLAGLAALSGRAQTAGKYLAPRRDANGPGQIASQRKAADAARQRRRAPLP